MLETYRILPDKARPPQWSRKILDQFPLLGTDHNVHLCEWTRGSVTLFTVTWDALADSPSDCDWFSTREFDELADAEAYFNDWKTEQERGES
jgi:hypothetical protein